MGFFIFLIVGGIIFFLIIQRRNKVRDEWSQAASRLGLNYSGGGLVNPHWIYGKKAGLRYDIKTFARSASGNANQKWTGYRVRFHQSADLLVRVTESARKQLTSRFPECEIDDEGIFCARPGIDNDAPTIIGSVERLQSVAERLLAEAEAESAGPPPPIPVPPPVPEPEPQVTEVETAETISTADLVDEPPALEELEPEIAIALAPESVFELDEDEPVEEFEPIEEAEIAAPEEKEPLLTLARVSSDLFDSGRNHFQITQRFSAEYDGLSMIGEGKLVRAEAYSNDRVFGRGPGTLAEVEIHKPEEPLPGHHTIRAVVQLPETASARALRGNLGDTVTISGTMLRCDAFEGRIFLGAGEIA